jgi:hypothetical protein
MGDINHQKLHYWHEGNIILKGHKGSGFPAARMKKQVSMFEPVF